MSGKEAGQNKTQTLESFISLVEECYPSYRGLQSGRNCLLLLYRLLLCLLLLYLLLP